MKRYIEIICIVLGFTTIYFSWQYFQLPRAIEDKLKIIAFGAGFVFFAYKILTGWLFINLNVNLEPKRESKDTDDDHLALAITLEKGNIDSLWISSVECRISECREIDNEIILEKSKNLEAFGTKKRDPITGDNVKKKDYWTGRELPLYTLSPNEKAVFSCYTTVSNTSVIAVEIIVIGTRPFYGIEQFWTRKRIQWRSSFVVLPRSKNTEKQLTDT